MNGDHTVLSARHFLVVALLLLGNGAHAASLFDDIGGELSRAQLRARTKTDPLPPPRD